MTRPRVYLLSLAVVLAAILVAAPGALAARDHAGTARNVLPPGEAGSIPPTRNSTDQIPLYDNLTPLFDRVGTDDVQRLFKSARFGTEDQGPTRVEDTPRPGVRIVRDRYGVAHITGRTRDDVMYGAGWVTVTDRSALAEALRGPGRLAAVGAPGVDPFGLASQLRRFTPSGQTEQFIGRQADALRAEGPKGRRILRDIDLYVEGINANYRVRGGAPPQRWTRNDVFAIISILAGIFGEGGGDEATRSEFLDGLRDRLGRERGRTVFDDLRLQFDDEHPHTISRTTPYGAKIRNPRGNVVLDNGSYRPIEVSIASRAGRDKQPKASNALVVNARRSTNGHPLWAAGPQVGYFYPQVLMEMDLHGGGIDARGVGVPGFSNALLIGRGQDFGWSLTSANNDITDQYAETLCGGRNDRYLYRGECRPMGTFYAGALEGLPFGGRVAFRTTVHGPVTGYATVNGRRVAIAEKRSTRGREVVSALLINDLMTNKVDSASSFLRAAQQFEATFNIFYEDSRDTAVFSSGLLPLRAPGVDMSLPTIGDGRFEWRGFLSGSRHPQAVNPSDGTIRNWNQKPAPGWSAADDQWSYGSVHRVDLFDHIDRRQRHTMTSVVQTMNRAATQDLRNVEVLPPVDRLLRTGPAPNARTAEMLRVLRRWRDRGSSRLDRDLDGNVDDPGAAIMDVVFEKWARATVEPVLGADLTDQMAEFHSPDDVPSSQGSSFGGGWYSYVDKDVRRVNGESVRDPFATRFCGQGNRTRCRDSLWAALDQAGQELTASEGTPDPESWRADARSERITFVPGVLRRTMRWTNRPTFQQLLNFTSDRSQAGAGTDFEERPPCTITGTADNDVLAGTPGDDVICAGAGNDVVRAGGGDDTVYGGADNDTLQGGPGDDGLYGEGGTDALNLSDRERGNDFADGGEGRDSCTGDAEDTRVACE